MGVFQVIIRLLHSFRSIRGAFQSKQRMGPGHSTARPKIGTHDAMVRNSFAVLPDHLQGKHHFQKNRHDVTWRVYKSLSVSGVVPQIKRSCRQKLEVATFEGGCFSSPPSNFWSALGRLGIQAPSIYRPWIPNYFEHRSMIFTYSKQRANGIRHDRQVIYTQERGDRQRNSQSRTISRRCRELLPIREPVRW